ncbi:MAG: redoxin domain-containing protein [Alphaproteobacteria bacterium]|nr:redoxin domain-containing protein [Alphaproteobacteria bacterium]
MEANGFRDRIQALAEKNTILLGITFSPIEDLKTWDGDIGGREIGFGAALLSDADRSVAIAYGAAESQSQERPKRISVLVGADGKVVKIYEVSDAEAHPAEVLGDLN